MNGALKLFGNYTLLKSRRLFLKSYCFLGNPQKSLCLKREFRRPRSRRVKMPALKRAENISALRYPLFEKYITPNIFFRLSENEFLQ